MKTLATFVLCLSLLAGFTACDKDDDNMGTLIMRKLRYSIFTPKRTV